MTRMRNSNYTIIFRSFFYCLLTILLFTSSVVMAARHKSYNLLDSIPYPTRSQTNTLSFDFQNIEIKSLLQIIAKHSGLNFIISDAVKGNITLNLHNVTWNKALNIIIKTQGL